MAETKSKLSISELRAKSTARRLQLKQNLGLNSADEVNYKYFYHTRCYLKELHYSEKYRSIYNEHFLI